MGAKDNWRKHWESIGVMRGCIDFLLRNTLERKIAWEIDGFVGALNGAIKCKGVFSDGSYAIIEQVIVCTHFWNKIELYDSDGEFKNSCLPDWEHGKDFWLLISTVREQILDKEFTEHSKRVLEQLNKWPDPSYA